MEQNFAWMWSMLSGERGVAIDTRNKRSNSTGTYVAMSDAINEITKPTRSIFHCNPYIPRVTSFWSEHLVFCSQYLTGVSGEEDQLIYLCRSREISVWASKMETMNTSIPTI
jgi:hypothetical protein